MVDVVEVVVVAAAGVFRSRFWSGVLTGVAPPLPSVLLGAFMLAAVVVVVVVVAAAAVETTDEDPEEGADAVCPAGEDATMAEYDLIDPTPAADVFPRGRTETAGMQECNTEDGQIPERGKGIDRRRTSRNGSLAFQGSCCCYCCYVVDKWAKSLTLRV